MLNALSKGHQSLYQLLSLYPEGCFIDATLGNGHDFYRMLTHPIFKGTVYGFDIQEEAIEATKKRIAHIPADRYQIIQDSHHKIDHYLSESQAVHGAIFNLGYLPGSDHQITTKAETTIEAVSKILDRLIINGKIIIVVYTGHPGGLAESDALISFTQSLDPQFYQVAIYKFINQKNQPPYLLMIEKV